MARFGFAGEKSKIRCLLRRRLLASTLGLFDFCCNPPLDAPESILRAHSRLGGTNHATQKSSEPPLLPSIRFCIYRAAVSDDGIRRLFPGAQICTAEPNFRSLVR